MERVIWHNGKYLPESEAKVSVYDSAMMFGDCVFEMTRSFKGKQFKLKEHLERLIMSAKFVRIPMTRTTIDEIESACLDLQDINKFEPDDEHRLMINITRGVLPMYSDVSGTGTNIMITDFPLRWTVAGMGQLFETGINAVTPSQRAIPAHLLEPRVKSRSRMHLLMANIEVSGYKGDNNWPLLLNDSGYITEGTGCNFFIINNKDIATPRDGILEGISRKYLLNEYSCIYEGDINIYDVMKADEAFVTATPFCMLPVTSINGRPIGNGKVGDKFKEMLGYWSSDVGVDIKGQIQAWDKGMKDGPSAYKFK